MNKLELVDHIATEADLTKVAAATALDAVLGGIEKTLKKGEEVRLVGFGTFSVRERAAGKGRNPATGKEFHMFDFNCTKTGVYHVFITMIDGKAGSAVCILSFMEKL